MRLISLYRVELRRLLLSRLVWFAGLLSMCTPLLGYCVEVYNGGMSDIYIANPVLSGTSAGAVVWAVVMMAETSRLHRGSADILADAAVSPRVLSAARVFAMITISAAAVVLCTCLYLPYTALKMEYLFQGPFYFANFLMLMMPTWWIAVLFAEGLYQITRRLELSAVLYALLVLASLSSYAENDYFMRWLNPKVVTYSDGFTSWWPLRIGLYTRLLWLCIAAGVWLCGLLCIRRYEKNLVLSFFNGMKKIYLPVLAAFFCLSGAGLWICQPFIDHEPELSDENSFIDTPVTQVSGMRYFVTADPLFGCIEGTAEYDIKEPYTGEDKLLFNPGCKIRRMTYDGKEIAFRTEADDLNGVRSTYFTLPDIPGKTLVIAYGGIPRIRKTYAPYAVNLSVDQDYISLGSTSVVPLLNYECEKGASLAITIPDTLTPYLNDMPMTEHTANGDGTMTWTSEGLPCVDHFAAGNYQNDTFTAAGNAVDFVYGKAYEEPVEQYDIPSAVIEVFEYCTEHYGGLGFAEDNTIILQQVSSMLMGGQAREGYVEWFENVLSPLTLSDPERGASASEVFIHEMIHQWWGGYGLQCDWQDDLWTEEGLTVYSTYRLVKEKYGALYAEQYYVDEWRKAVEAQERNFYNRHPEYLEKLPEKYQAQLQAENGGTNMYMRMPLMILKAEQLVGGEGKMDKILRNMYADRESYLETPFTYQDFLDYCGLEEEDLELDAGDYTWRGKKPGNLSKANALAGKKAGMISGRYSWNREEARA